MTEASRAAVACPHCGQINDAHLGVDVPIPRDGDIGICWSCRGLAIFTVHDGQVGQRLPTAAENAKLRADPRLRQMYAAMAESYRPSEAVELIRPTGEAQ